MVFKPVQGDENRSLRLYWKIYIWQGVEYHTDSTISLCLFEDEMKMLLKYLNLITGEAAKTDVKHLLDKGIIVEDDEGTWKRK